MAASSIHKLLFGITRAEASAERLQVGVLVVRTQDSEGAMYPKVQWVLHLHRKRARPLVRCDAKIGEHRINGHPKGVVLLVFGGELPPLLL